MRGLLLLLLATPLAAQQHAPSRTHWVDTVKQPAATIMTYGTTTVAVDSVDTIPVVKEVVINPGDNWASMVAAAPAGTQYRFRSGTYRFVSIVPRKGDTFVGDPGAVLSGARVLTGFQADAAGHWWVSNQTQQNTKLQPDKCDPKYPGCYFNEELWVDGAYYQHMTTLAAVTTGSQKWYFDYDADKIYIGTNPAGHTVETSVTPWAFRSGQANVTIKGLIIEKYATELQHGCVEGGPTWTVDSSDVRWCHGAAIKLTGDNWKVRWNRVHLNGSSGLHGSGTNGLVYGNDVFQNDTAHILRGWEGGGSKWVYTTGLIVRRNHFHDNLHNGIWLDINNVDSRVDSNEVDHNRGKGIFEEISYGAEIDHNSVHDNGQLPTDNFASGAEIICSASSDCHIHDNVIRGFNPIILFQQDRQSGTQGPHIVQNANVHDNTVTLIPAPVAAQALNRGTLRIGFLGAFQQSDFLHTRNNCFHTNTYDLTAVPAGTKVFMFGGAVTDAAWLTSGCNAGETIHR